MLDIFSDVTVIQTILSSINDVIIIKDNQGNVSYVNHKMQDILGYSPSEIIGLSGQQAISLLVGENFLQDIAKNSEKLTKGHEITITRKFIHKSGQIIPFEVKAFPLYDQNSVFCGELLVLNNLHEELLYKITSLVNSSLSFEDVLNNTAYAVVEYLGLSSSAVFLLNESKDEVRLISHNAYPSKEEMAKIVYKKGDSPPWRAILQGSPIYIRNLRTEPTISEHARKFHKDKSTIVFPLIYNREILGAIAFDATSIREFSSKELILFKNIADQVGLAIKNAQLYSKVEHLSITDGLTGLYNYRFLEGRLQEELERAERGHTSFAVLMVDVDNFKVYNDTYGHPHGDTVLRQLANLFRDNVRSFDIVARYGGEEFAVILLDCDPEMALNISERLRATVEEHDFSDNQHDVGKDVTVSIGLAMYPEAKTFHELIAHADKALYHAKSQGKNQVTTY